MTSLRAALQIVRAYSDTMPAPVFDIARDLGLQPTGEPMPAKISGKIVRSEDAPAGYTIIYNSDHHLNRQRFTVAHEIGHFIFHRDLLAFGVGDTVAYRAEGSGRPNDRIGPTQETEANRFAANLLMPAKFIERLRAEGVTRPADMAKRLGVSEAAVRIRLGLPVEASLFPVA